MKTFKVLRNGASFRLVLFFVFSISIVAFFAVVSANAQTYQGQAKAARVSIRPPAVNPTIVAVADTGPLPSAGGTISLSSAGTSVAGVLTVGSSTVSTSGSGGTTNSTASVNAVNISVLGIAITADVAQATATTSCVAMGGSSVITNLKINGSSVTVTGQANQTIVLPGGVGSLVINEQIAEMAVITVNAMHIHVTSGLTVTDILIAGTRAGVDCAGTPGVNRFGGYGKSIVLRQNLGLPPAIVDTFLNDTGWLPRAGGVINSSIAPAVLDGVVSTGTATASTSGGIDAGTPDATQSSSQVNQLFISVLSGAVTVAADSVNAGTQCSCDIARTASCSGTSSLTNLVVTTLGVSEMVIVTGSPNQIINIPAGLGNVTLTINGRNSSGPANITATALRVDATLNGVATDSVIVSNVHSDIVCGLSPTAAPASVSGRVTTASGAGVRGIAVQIVDRSTGEVRSTLTNSFGFYAFNDLDVGDFYQVSVASKKYQFAQAVKSFSLTADMTDVNFTAVK